MVSPYSHTPDCAACFQELGNAAKKACAACHALAHQACWDRTGGCARFTCKEASAFRRQVLAHLDLQLTADIAVVSWTPILLLGVIVARCVTTSPGPLGAALCTATLALLTLPVLVACRKRALLRADSISLETLVGIEQIRHERQSSYLYRHRSTVARFETYMSNPLLFVVLIGAGLLSVLHRSIAGGLTALSLLGIAASLFVGPSRRARENPIRDFPRWSRELEEALARSDAGQTVLFVTRDGNLVQRERA